MASSDERDWIFLSRSRSRLLKISLVMKTGIETYRIAVLISRLVSSLSGLQSWYWDWYRDFQDGSHDIKTGIEIFRIAVLILRLVLRLFTFQSLNQDWYWNCQNLNSLIETLIETSRLQSLDWDWYPIIKNSSSFIDTGIRPRKYPVPLPIRNFGIKKTGCDWDCIYDSEKNPFIKLYGYPRLIFSKSTLKLQTNVDY